jgi:hypothetical protein
MGSASYKLKCGEILTLALSHGERGKDADIRR